MKQKLKLYVWTGFCTDYTDGLAVAIATNETKAKELISKEYSIEPYQWGKLTVRPLNKSFAVSVYGGG